MEDCAGEVQGRDHVLIRAKVTVLSLEGLLGAFWSLGFRDSVLWVCVCGLFQKYGQAVGHGQSAFAPPNLCKRAAATVGLSTLNPQPQIPLQHLSTPGKQCSCDRR